jgi:hypothetical protein
MNGDIIYEKRSSTVQREEIYTIVKERWFRIEEMNSLKGMQ